jgi:hypothetical protein
MQRSFETWGGAGLIGERLTWAIRMPWYLCNIQSAPRLLHIAHIPLSRGGVKKPSDCTSVPGHVKYLSMQSRERGPSFCGEGFKVVQLSGRGTDI